MTTDDELTWLPAYRIRDLVAQREISPVEVIEHFLSRIEEHSSLNAFQSVDAVGAREEAQRAERALLGGGHLGTLYGIPVSIKEYIPVAGLPHRDSNGRITGVPKRDALSVRRLRDAGAIVVGTNTAMGITDAELNPYDRELEARNPWDRGRVTGWSSSGGAAAAAAALVPIALGNDGGGSTRLPAAGSGVVGLHPTPGLVPEVKIDSPKLPALTTSAGPICRSVVDAALTLQAIAGPDGHDFAGTKLDPPDYLEFLDSGVDGMRLAWTDDFGFARLYGQDGSEKVIASIRDAAAGFHALGAEVFEVPKICDDFWESYVTTNYLFQIAMEVPEPSPSEWEAALDARHRTWSAFRRVLTENDLLLCPTMQMLSPTLENWERAWLHEAESYPHGVYAPSYTCYTHLFNWLAFPAISVPCGFLEGLPIGLQIVGLPGREGKILQAAQAFQAVFPATSERPPDL